MVLFYSVKMIFVPDIISWTRNPEWDLDVCDTFWTQLVFFVTKGLVSASILLLRLLSIVFKQFYLVSKVPEMSVLTLLSLALTNAQLTLQKVI